MMPETNYKAIAEIFKHYVKDTTAKIYNETETIILQNQLNNIIINFADHFEKEENKQLAKDSRNLKIWNPFKFNRKEFLKQTGGEE